MIYTVTFNPSLDYVVTADEFKTGQINRTKSEIIFPGGKGINVSIVLKNLGIESTILGFTAGFTGDAIKRLLKELDCREELTDTLCGLSRINVKIKSDNSEETELNGMGPEIDEEAFNKLITKIKNLSEGDGLVLAGSIPKSVPSDIYMKLLELTKKKNVLVAVDATGKLLENVLKFKPFVIKPNNHELGELFGVELNNKKDVALCAKRLKETGAVNVLVSMAGDGAVLITENGTIYEANAPKGMVINSVGAGDSMLAGFLYGYKTTGNYEKAFKYGVSAGSASAFSKGLAKKQDIEKLYDEIKVNKMSL